MGLGLLRLKGDQNSYLDESLSRQIDALGDLTFQQLLHKHIELFGEPPGSRHKQQVARRIGWRLQVLAEGGLAERARRRALEIANDADLRLLPPHRPLAGCDPISGTSATVMSARDRRLPEPAMQAKAREERNQRSMLESVQTPCNAPDIFATAGEGVPARRRICFVEHIAR
jgi:hypothetical protein